MLIYRYQITVDFFIKWCTNSGILYIYVIFYLVLWQVKSKNVLLNEYQTDMIMEW